MLEPAKIICDTSHITIIFDCKMGHGVKKAENYCAET